MLRTIIITLLLITSSACQHNSQSSAKLYQQLGDVSGIESIVKELIVEIANDDLLRPRFKDSDIPIFHQRLSEQICEVADGPCKYTGDSMPEVHKGLGIKTSEFNRLVELLRISLHKHQIPYQTQNDLLKRLALMHKDITYK